MDNELPTLKFNYDRRFGVEIELNSFDRRDFNLQSLLPGEMPQGADYISNLIMEKLNASVKIQGWKPTHNNYEDWVIKPDRSCGMEVCSPAEKGWVNLRNIVDVVGILRKDERVVSDERCSFHVHVNVLDCLSRSIRMEGFASSMIYDWSKCYDLVAVLAWWIKCEFVFLESVPDSRKRNQYCIPLGQTDDFNSDEEVSERVIHRMGDVKYFTCNCYHLRQCKRPTVEFRIMENKACLDPIVAKHWMVLLIHFVERAKHYGAPQNYRWLEPAEVFDFLGFSGDHKLDPLLEETRAWFLSRILTNMRNSNLPGIWTPPARHFARQQIVEIARRLSLEEVVG